MQYSTRSTPVVLCTVPRSTIQIKNSYIRTSRSSLLCILYRRARDMHTVLSTFDKSDSTDSFGASIRLLVSVCVAVVLLLFASAHQIKVKYSQSTVLESRRRHFITITMALVSATRSGARSVAKQAVRALSSGAEILAGSG